MRSGTLRYLVTLQRPLGESTRRGHETAWENVQAVWASIRQVRVAEEQGRTRQIVVVGTYELRMWNLAGFDETWRIVHGQFVYNVVSVDQPNALVRETVIIARRDKLRG
jgi:head-tail adaptor